MQRVQLAECHVEWDFYVWSTVPWQITAEDREELQRDRENAMKCEQALARQKQEKYFDLVDKVQNVLRRIEVGKHVILFCKKWLNVLNENSFDF